MPGSNCALPGCTTSRYKIHNGISIFKVTNRKGEYYAKWRKDILAVLLKYREVDENLKPKLKKFGVGDIYICEKHFPTTEIEYTSK